MILTMYVLLVSSQCFKKAQGAYRLQAAPRQRKAGAADAVVKLLAEDNELRIDHSCFMENQLADDALWSTLCLVTRCLRNQELIRVPSSSGHLREACRASELVAGRGVHLAAAQRHAWRGGALHHHAQAGDQRQGLPLAQACAPRARSGPNDLAAALLDTAVCDCMRRGTCPRSGEAETLLCCFLRLAIIWRPLLSDLDVTLDDTGQRGWIAQR